MNVLMLNLIAQADDAENFGKMIGYVLVAVFVVAVIVMLIRKNR